jgi:hypothetical protein
MEVERELGVVHAGNVPENLVMPPDVAKSTVELPAAMVRILFVVPVVHVVIPVVGAVEDVTVQ